MLHLITKAPDGWDEINEVFDIGKTYDIWLEHSLSAVAEWEAIWHVPYFDTELTSEQSFSYVNCMLVKGDPDGLLFITDDDVQRIKQYLKDDHSAAIVVDIAKEGQGRAKRSFITCENIYGWMFDLRIPLEWENRNLNRLLKLIRVMQKSREPEKKKTAAERAREYQALNKARQKQHNTKG